MATHVRMHAENYAAYITFFEEEERRPCTLDWDSIRELDECISEILQNITGFSVVVLQSASPKSFIVGANIAVLETLNSENIIEWVHTGHQVFNRLMNLPIPVIAKVKSLALGGGLELAMACDFIIAGEDAKFGQPEASLGVMPGWGGTFRLPMLVGPNRAKELFATGRSIDAKTAYDWGLVNRVCTNDELEDCVNELIQQISKNDLRVINYIKNIINDEWLTNIKKDDFLEATTSSVCMSSQSTKERLRDFFGSRKKK
ncbi:MAG TPA: enoyl-CoA hydratase/isomerase family protein [Clostridiales bacterium]|nr:enoyl-CoA hydratase/isomerase family protein [Clostridiales bacterium]